MQTQAKRIADFLCQLAPADLAGDSVRVLTVAECDFPVSPELHGLFIRDAAAVVGDPRPGESAIIVNDVAIAAEARTLQLPAWHETLRVAVHELAHAIADGYRPLRAPPAEVQRVIRTGALPRPERFLLPAWHGHGLRWLRALLHLADRAEALGHHFPRARLAGVQGLGLTRTETYEACLGDEPRRLAGVPLFEVLEIPAPREFLQLWSSDVAAWRVLE